MACKKVCSILMPLCLYAVVPNWNAWAYSWTWRHTVAMSQTVSSALPAALWQWSVRKKNQHRKISEDLLDMMQMIKNRKNIVFVLEHKNRTTARRNANFFSWATRLPIEMNVHTSHLLSQVLQIPACGLWNSKILISNSSPLQGLRVNWVACLWLCIYGSLWNEPAIQSSVAPVFHQLVLPVLHECWSVTIPKNEGSVCRASVQNVLSGYPLVN